MARLTKIIGFLYGDDVWPVRVALGAPPEAFVLRIHSECNRFASVPAVLILAAKFSRCFHLVCPLSF